MLKSVLSLVFYTIIVSSQKFCSQISVDNSIPIKQKYTFEPYPSIKGFYQWENNYGYCGEVSLLQSGMSYGQWVSQANTRIIASPFQTAIAQTGKTREGIINYYSQLLLDDEPSSSSNNFGKAATNMKLKYTSFSSIAQPTGLSGYKSFMNWIKQNVINGYYVSIGVMLGGSDDVYDHIVNVVRIESNFPKNDTTYHGSDIIYIEDHGALTKASASFSSAFYNNPSIPPGTGGTRGCTPYIYGYSFDILYAPLSNTKNYQVILPTNTEKNYGTVVTGIQDINKDTLPVYLTILNSTVPKDVIIGYNYEHPMIGKSSDADSYTNILPKATTMTIQASVYNLKINEVYNLYLYKFPKITSGPLQVPISYFNTNSGLATQKIVFIANSTVYNYTLSIISTDTVIFRCVSIKSN